MISSTVRCIHVITGLECFKLIIKIGFKIRIVFCDVILQNSQSIVQLVTKSRVWSRAVKSGGSTDWEVVGTAIPVGTHWAAAHGTVCLVRSTLVVDLGKLHQLEPLGLKGAVSSSGSAHKIRTAEPIGHRAATTGTPGLLRSTTTGHAATRAGTLVRSTLSALGRFDQLGLLSLYLEASSHCQKSTNQ